MFLSSKCSHKDLNVLMSSPAMFADANPIKAETGRIRKRALLTSSLDVNVLDIAVEDTSTTSTLFITDQFKSGFDNTPRELSGVIL